MAIRLRELLLFLIVPAVLTALAAATLRGEHRMDPDYAYLFCSINTLYGERSMAYMHPGGPVQLLGAVLVWLTHAVTGEHADLVTDVIHRPEHYLSSICIAFTLLYAGTCLAGAVALRWLGARLAEVIAVQLSLLLALESVKWLARLMCEPLVLLWSLVLAIGTAAIVVRPALARNVWVAVLLGAACGLGAATKFTFLPVIVVPLVALAGIVGRVVFLATGVSVFGLAIYPSWWAFKQFHLLAQNIATRTGPGGSGEAELLNLGRVVANLGKLAAMEPFFVAILVLSAVAVAVGFKTGALRGSSDDVRARRRVLIVLVLVQLANLLLVSKTFMAKGLWLAPALPLMGVNLLVLLRSFELPVTVRRPVVVRAAGIAVFSITVLAWLVMVLPTAHHSRFDRHRRFMEAAAGRYDGYRFVYTQYVHARPNALQFGNQWSFLQHGEKLAEIYPDVRFYNPNRNVFLDFLHRPKTGAVPLQEIFPPDRPSLLILLRGQRDALETLDLPHGLVKESPPEDLQSLAREAGLVAVIIRPARE